MKLLAAEHDSTVQALMREALNDLFVKHGKPERPAGEGVPGSDAWAARSRADGTSREAISTRHQRRFAERPGIVGVVERRHFCDLQFCEDVAARPLFRRVVRKS
jgi:hypothetical protein